MLGVLATLMFLAAMLLALVVLSTTMQTSWTRIVSALTLGAPVAARIRRPHVVRVNRAFRPIAPARPAPRVLSAAA